MVTRAILYERGKCVNILFMCVANSARSQLAEGLARKMFGNAVTIESAGSEPGKLNPFAVKAMEEIGVDISKHYSKSTDDLSPRFILALDYVITLCEQEVCPVMVSRAKKLHWPLPDPASKEGTNEEKLERFRKTREALIIQLRAFAKETGLKASEG